jgi:hypothetical protein
MQSWNGQSGGAAEGTSLFVMVNVCKKALEKVLTIPKKK